MAEKRNPIVCFVRAGLEMTVSAVESMLRQDIPVHVGIVCNGAPKDVVDGLYWQFGGPSHPNVSIVENEAELSVAAAWNREIRGHVSSGGHVLVCNNDIELRPEYYRLLLADGGDFVTGIGDADRDRVFSGEVHPESRRPHPDFSCYLIRRAAWEKVGPFDEGFEVAYCEDCDYHIRMHQAGIEAVSIGVPFYHRVSGTMKSLSAGERERVHAAADRNRDRFRKKWGCLPGDADYYAYFAEAAS